MARDNKNSKKIPMGPEQESKPKRLKTSLEILTLLIALWGAGLSTWVYWQQTKSRSPRIYVRMDVQASGFDKDGKPLGDVQVLFSNVGESTFTIAPRIQIIATDSRSGEMVRTEASFLKKEKVKESRLYQSDLPPTLKPGEEAIAKSATLSLAQLVDPLDYCAVLFELSNGERYEVLLADSDYLKRDQKTNSTVDPFVKTKNQGVFSGSYNLPLF